MNLRGRDLLRNRFANKGTAFSEDVTGQDFTTVRTFFHPTAGATTIAFDTTRKAGAIAASLALDPIRGVDLVTPAPLHVWELERVHDAEYVQAVLTGVPRDLATSNELGWEPGLAEAVMWTVAAVRDAALDALEGGGIAGALASGLHHAAADRGRGYCTFNGLVVAGRAAIDAGAERILVLDLDAHCGGGTAALIRSIPEMEQVDVSVDVFDMYPSRPAARLTFCGADDYLTTIERALLSIDTAESVDLVLYNAGMDPHEDAGGVRGITAAVLERREAMVFGWARSNALPLAWVLAGGYSAGNEGAALDMAGLVDLHRLTIGAACDAAARGFAA